MVAKVNGRIKLGVDMPGDRQIDKKTGKYFNLRKKKEEEKQQKTKKKNNNNNWALSQSFINLLHSYTEMRGKRSD